MPYHFRAGVVRIVATATVIAGASAAALADVEEPAPILARLAPESGDEARSRRVAELLAAPLSVDDAIEVTILNHPTAAVAVAELASARAELDHARLIENPVAHIERRFPDPPLEIGVRQNLIDFILRPKRTRVARETARAADLSARDSLHELAALTRAAYFELQAATAIRDLDQKVEELMQSGAELADRQGEAGNLSRLERERIASRHDEARLAAGASAVEVARARVRLARQLGVTSRDATWDIARELQPPAAHDLDLNQLESLAGSQRRDLMALGARRDAADHAIRVAGWSAIPEISLGLHFEREPEGGSSIGPEVEFTLPLFDRGQAQRRKARADGAHAEAELMASEQAIASDVRDAAARLEAAYARYTFHQSVVVPRRARIREQTLLEYNAMLTGAYDVLDAKAAEFVAEAESILALRDYWVAHSDLERAIGGPLVASTREKATLDAAPSPQGEPTHDHPTPDH